jgi:hypothetical protein
MRVQQLAAARGKTIADVCRESGLSGSYFAKPAGRSGRSVEALMSISKTLQISIIELIGSTNHRGAAPTDDNLTRMALVAEVAAYLYVALGSRRQIPRDINTLEVIAEILRNIEGSSNQP